MAQSNCDSLGVNFFESCVENVTQAEERQVHPDFISSSWYKDIIYVLHHLQALLELSKTKARYVRLKATKICIINNYLYWKDPGSILLNCPLEDEARKKIKELHSEYCGGHLYWKTTSHNILRAEFY